MGKIKVIVCLVAISLITVIVYKMNVFETSIGVKNVVARAYDDSNFPKNETVNLFTDVYGHIETVEDSFVSRADSRISAPYIRCRTVQTGTKVTVCWNKMKKSFIIHEDLDLDDFIWRNQKNGFCYFMYTNNDTRMELHYVEIKKDFNNIYLSNKIIASRNDGNANPYVRWSNDGQYFTWPDHAMINIYKFGTRKRWYSKSLIIYEGGNKKVINCPNPPMAIYVHWGKKGKYLVFTLVDSDNPDDGEILYTGLIDLRQFGLD